MNFIITKEEYLGTLTAWTKIPSRTAVDHIFYNALRGHDLKRGFSPIQDQRRLDNGHTEWRSFDDALREAQSAITLAPWHINDPRYITAFAATCKRLGNRYGTTFTPGLITALQEALK
jgi:hypothetical protein